jgi:hypothetical protein
LEDQFVCPLVWFLSLPNTNKIESTTLKEWITDSRNTPSTTNPEDEEIVDDPRKKWQRIDAGTDQTT